MIIGVVAVFVLFGGKIELFKITYRKENEDER